MHLVTDYSEQWLCRTPALIPDGGGGTLMLAETFGDCLSCLEHKTVCRASYVHDGTKRKDLKELGHGTMVKHYFTKCSACGAQSVS